MRIVFLLAAAFAASASAEPLRVCATLPDLGDLARSVGGEDVEVTVFAKGQEDPHFVEARPGFLRAANRADVFVLSGLELEAGWAPVLLRGANNPRIQMGQPGYLDASTAIAPLEVPAGVVDRSMGDVHAQGNPHYLLDPRNGMKVAALLRDRFSVLRPDRADAFSQRYEALAQELARRVKDWTGRLKALGGPPVAADHNLWPYFADFAGLRVVALLEPKPGLPPTTRHLEGVVALMKARSVKVILESPYFDPRHAHFVAAQTGAVVAHLAHQCGSRPGTETYAALIEHNVKELEAAFRAAPGR